MKRSVISLVCVLSALVGLPAYAYVDPGTGSMAVQMIIGGLVAGAFVIKTYYYQLKRRIARLFGRDSGYKTETDSASVAANPTDGPPSTEN
jgi:membrane associated rhomboid family serine protease